jgi:hypothetical protein
VLVRGCTSRTRRWRIRGAFSDARLQLRVVGRRRPCVEQWRWRGARAPMRAGFAIP